MATAPAPAAAQPAQGNSGGKQQAPPAVPFRCGTQNTTNLDGYTQTITLGTTTALPNYNPSVNSYLRGCWINTAATASGNAATVV